MAPTTVVRAKECRWRDQARIDSAASVLVRAKEGAHEELDGLERLGAHPRFAVGREHQQIAFGRPAEHAERLLHRIDEPVMRHLEAVIAIELLHPIQAWIGGRDHLTHPVWP